MTTVCLVSHGNLCLELINSYEMISGKNQLLKAIPLDDSGAKAFSKRLEIEITELLKKGSVLILADLKGGTPFNESMKLLLQYPDDIELVSGVNLPMLLEIGLKLSLEDIPQSHPKLGEFAYTTGTDGIDIIVVEEDEDNDKIEF
jgi:mannose PTS system EIIA component